LIEIDDAGSGSLVGQTCIGVLRKETGKYLCGFIDLKYYQPESFKQKAYLREVINITKNIFEKLKVPKKEPIIICQGYIFDLLREWLTIQGYNWRSGKIEGLLQQKVESSFASHAISLGLPENYIKYTRFPFHFHRLLKWVYADYKNRSNYCKKGWPSWQRYGYLHLDISYGILRNYHYYCLKCGKKILPKSEVKIIKYVSNRPTTLYLHKDC
jgi:hypothetical protein